MTDSNTTAGAPGLDRLLLALLDTLRHTPVRLRPDGGLQRGQGERWLDALGVTGGALPARWAPLGVLLELTDRLGLAAPVQGYLRPQPEGARALFGPSTLDRTRILLRAWEAGPRAGGWAQAALGDEGAALPSPPPLRAGARAWLLGRLAELGPLPASTSARRFCLGLSGPPHPDPPETWQAGLDVLAQLGAVDPEALARDTLALTAAGAFVLGAGPRPPSAAARDDLGQVLVQPSFQLVALVPPGGGLSLLYTLGRCARPEGPPPNFSYHMDATSLSRAASEGLSPGAVLTLLRSRCPHPLPQNVEHSVVAWGQTQRRTCLYRGVTLLEFDSPAELGEHWPTLELSPGACRVGPQRALLPANERSAVAQALGSNDFEDLDHSAPLAPALRMAEGTLVEADPSRLGLRVRGLLQALGAERRSPTTWSLDAEQAGAHLAPSAPGSEALRQQAHEAFQAGFPPELRVAAAAARGRLGTPALLSGVVLVCRDAHVLDLLLSLPELRARGRTSLGDRAIMLAPEDAPAVCTLLDQLGLGHTTELPAAGGVAPGGAPQALTGGDVLAAARLALTHGWELLVRYDPGARRPEEELRVQPLRLSERAGRHVLHARPAGQEGERALALAFVRAARVLPPPD